MTSSIALTEYVPLFGVVQGDPSAGPSIGDIEISATNIDAGGAGAPGQSLEIDEGPTLFLGLGTTYGGDGTSVFELPDLDGVTTIGTGQAPGLNPEALGQPTGTSTLPVLNQGSQTVSDYQPSLPVIEMIAVEGVFPSDEDQPGGGGSLDELGMIQSFAGATVPKGYLPADGRLLPINQYQALFSVLGTTYGGDGKTTFALPDLRGRAIIGASATDPVGTAVGQPTVTLTSQAGSFDNQQPSLALEYLISEGGIFPVTGGSSETDSDDAFIGQVVAFAGNYVPSGWALADGQLLSISSNEALFGLIGTTYGGDGIKTFALPNLEGKTIIGASDNLPVGTVLGADAGTTGSTGIAEDGYIAGGTVSYVSGPAGNGPVKTDGDGNFTLSGGTGPIQLTGGTDISTGVAFKGTLTAPSGFSIVSPLTTVLEAVMAANPQKTETQADADVVAALGLAAGTDLKMLDAVAAAKGGDLAAFKAGSEVLDAVTLIAAAGGSADAAYADIAALVTAGGPVDLTDASTLATDDAKAATNDTACYCQGTRILTERGDVAIETLMIGDLAVTASGERRPIVWIGHRTFDLARHPDPEAVWPVRVQASAFGPGLPSRELWLSPCHAVLVDDVLIPIIRLENGKTIAQVPVPSVTYWHVELESHDILIAEGLPAESYLDCGNRTAFANSGVFVELHPDFEPKTLGETCAPLKDNGLEVATAKRRLLARAEAMGFGLTDDPGLHLLADGVAIEPKDLGGGRFCFLPPPDCNEIRLVSRTWCPAHLKPESGDRRDLGVLVTRLEIDERLHDLGALDEGWLKLEGNSESPCRWTAGSAALPAGARRVVVRVGSTPRYWIAQEQDKRSDWTRSVAYR